MNFTDILESIPSSTSPFFRFLVIIGILIFTALLGKVITIYLRRSLKEKMSREHLEITLKVLYYSLVVLVAILFILPLLGIEPSGLIVAGGIAGIIIGFASQSIVSNLISGIFLMIERPIKIGNQVKVDGISGWVEDINIISTIIRTYDGLYVRVPNDKVFTTNLINYVENVARRFEYEVGIRYSDDADQAIGIIKDVIHAHPFALVNPKPSVFLDSLGDNSMNIKVRIWAPASEWFGVKTELLWKIKTTIEENGIEVPFPQRTIWFGNETKKEELPGSQ